MGERLTFPRHRKVDPPRPVSSSILSDELASDPEITHKDRNKFVISRGGRVLNVYIRNHGTFLYARTYLAQETRAPRVKGLTTHLYMKALEIFKSAANKRQVELNYRLITSHDKMKKWAVSKRGGQGVFDWDKSYWHPVEWMFIKTIKPEIPAEIEPPAEPPCFAE